GRPPKGRPVSEAEEPGLAHGEEVARRPPLGSGARVVELGPERPYEVLLDVRRVLAGDGDVEPRRGRRGAEAVEGAFVAGDPLRERERAPDVERAPVSEHSAVNHGVEVADGRDDVEPGAPGEHVRDGDGV